MMATYQDLGQSYQIEHTRVASPCGLDFPAIWWLSFRVCVLRESRIEAMLYHAPLTQAVTKAHLFSRGSNTDFLTVRVSKDLQTYFRTGTPEMTI